VDLLFSDIRMAGRMDGLQLARWVREHRPGMEILLQTGFTELLTGDFTVLQKPYSPQELIAAIRTTLEKRREARH
jgi:DNA-binding NtrC family response regulator